eukprot:GCRY01001786.1.p1 GENE.GCRY01001786.1~~GCRY01001786.1.p1  ORF type:complete len:132 (-),score=25.79 GCRY01001786.1:54-449(-)
MNEDKDSILVIDEVNRARVLPSEKFDESETLNKNCKDFVEKISEFDSLVHEFVQSVDTQSELIENEKLKAIGHRIELERQEEHQKRKEKELNLAIAEKKHELERVVAEYESLQRILADQQVRIDKFQNAEI